MPQRTAEQNYAQVYDVAIIGAGMAGMATAARLQAAGLQTIVFEAHGLPGGCAGYFRRKGFAFDVGATTLVDFEPGGVGDELLTSIGMPPLCIDVLPGYVGWLPDRKVTLYRDHSRWAQERLAVLGDTPAHQAMWKHFDNIANAFWSASRGGVKLPIQSVSDALRAASSLGLRKLPLARHLRHTVGDALRSYGLQKDQALRGLLAMLIEDTVHSTIDQAPLINGVLGSTIRGAGLSRTRGGMYGFWREFAKHYRNMGGTLRVGTAVTEVSGTIDNFCLKTRRGDFFARRVVSSLPAELTAKLGIPEVSKALVPYVKRDATAMGGAVVAFVGVPECEVSDQEFTHHQLLQDYDKPLGNGNNMFISVSAPGDTISAPDGYRAVMISTHCELAPWENLSEEQYQTQKRDIGAHLISLARKVYPRLATHKPIVFEIATPNTYEKFTSRPRGAVGGVRQTLRNSNQHAIPHDLGVPGFWMCGDTTWPGLGTVACVLGSRLVAKDILSKPWLETSALLRSHETEGAFHAA